MNRNRSFTALPALHVHAACRACLRHIHDANVAADNAALDREIARRAKGWPFGLLSERWTREQARRYFESFTGLDAYMNPLWRIDSDQKITAKRLLALAGAAMQEAGDSTVHVTAEDFASIASFYGEHEGVKV